METKAAEEIREMGGIFVVVVVPQVSRRIIRKNISLGGSITIEQRTRHKYTSKLENCVCCVHTYAQTNTCMYRLRQFFSRDSKMNEIKNTEKCL